MFDYLKVSHASNMVKRQQSWEYLDVAQEPPPLILCWPQPLGGLSGGSYRQNLEKWGWGLFFTILYHYLLLSIVVCCLIWLHMIMIVYAIWLHITWNYYILWSCIIHIHPSYSLLIASSRYLCAFTHARILVFSQHPAISRNSSCIISSSWGTCL